MSRYGYWMVLVLLTLVILAEAQMNVNDKVMGKQTKETTDEELDRKIDEKVQKNQLQLRLMEQTLSAAIDQKSYIVFPGDAFWLEIPGIVDDPATLEVMPEGYLIIPKITRYKVSNICLDSVKKMVENDLQRYFPGSKISLTLVKMAKYQVYLSGEIAQRGALVIKNGDRLSEVITQAGGLTNLSNKWEIKITHNDNSTVNINYNRFLITGDMNYNPVIKPGDRIFFPLINFTDNYVKVNSNEERSGIYYLPYPMTIPDFLKEHQLMSGDLEYQKLSVIRYNKKFTIDLLNDTISFVLESKDQLSIQRIPKFVYVQGEVKEPGAYFYASGKKIEDYAGLAGLLSTASSADKYYVIPFGTNEKIYGREFVIQPGDMIYIPKSKQASFREILQTMSGVASIVVSVVSLVLVTK